MAARMQLKGKKVAILVTDGFEQVELTEPRQALQDAGAQTELVAPRTGKVKAWNGKEWGAQFDVECDLHRTDADAYDALLLPGGVMNPDHLRMNATAIRFVKAFFDANKPVAAICHGPWTLIDAGVVEGRRLTSWPSLQTDLRNAGAHWVDEPVVVDRRLVTSRKPDDLPAFNARMIEAFAEGRHAGASEPAQGSRGDARGRASSMQTPDEAAAGRDRLIENERRPMDPGIADSHHA